MARRATAVVEEARPLAAGDPGQCSETPCWSRTPLEINIWCENNGCSVEATNWSGSVYWDLGDGTVVRAQGVVEHMYPEVDDTYTVTARPVASSCMGSASKDHTVVIA